MIEYLSSRKNEKVQHMKKLGADRRYREQCGAFFCDGEKLLYEAAAHGMEIKTVFCCDICNVELPAGAEAYTVPREIIEYVSPMKTPQNVVVSCAMPADAEPVQAGRPYILLENIQDPGNVGTVLRTANAFGVGVLLMGACADPYGPKTVRASMGAVFRQPIYQITYEEIEQLVDAGAPLYGAALGEGCREITQVPLNRAIVAIGNEGQGLSRRLLDLCGQKVIIPMAPACESLNASVAAAIVMWEMRK